MKFSVTTSEQGAVARVTERSNKDGIILLDFEIEYESPRIPSMVKVEWNVSCIDLYSMWGPNLGLTRLISADWAKRTCRSRLAAGAPFHSLVSFDGMNGVTVAVSDAQTPIEIASGICEETSEVACELRFFTEQINQISSYHASIYVDTRRIRYEDALRGADRYLADQCGYPSAYIPDVAKRPMYSCWYSFHQDLDVEKILRQCELGKEMGMEAVIVDDGWQTDDSQRGYAYCGDWELCPTKIPDMKDFVDRVHQCGMKFILWYSVPFVGIYSKAYERFSDMFLDGTKETSGRDWAILDPRYPEVRKFLTDIYVKAKKEWGLDGFKLDFIDSFQIFKQTKAFDPRWDTLSLEDGVDRLLADVTSALREIDPEILIEFRQSYFGPAIRKYGNMIRVRDCPNDSLANHVYLSDMKFVLDRTPIHSDMLMWNYTDSVESAAHQVLCCLFSVPQISVLLDKLSDEHQKMLRFWLKYWNLNRDVLLDGAYYASSPEHLYTLVKASLNGKTIAVAHANAMLTVDAPFENLDFINATGEETLVLNVSSSIGKASCCVYDCLGNEVQSTMIDLTEGVHGFRVPKCGMVSLALTEK